MVTFELRKDEGNYIEGMTYGQGITLESDKLSWLMPGVTYTSHTLSEAGQIRIPVYQLDNEGAVTELCDEGVFYKGTMEFVTLLLDRKVSATFDSCFTVAGIVPSNWQRGINNVSLRHMAIGAQREVERELQANATVSTLATAGKTPFQILNQLKTEFRKKTTRWCDIALVSLDFYNEILSTQTQLGVTPASAAYVRGVVGTVAGLLIIPTDMENDVTLFTVEAINVAKPGSLAQIPGMGIVGAVDMAHAGISFNSGLVSKQNVQPNKIGVVTNVFKPFGLKVIPELTLTLPNALTP